MSFKEVQNYLAKETFYEQDNFKKSLLDNEKVTNEIILSWANRMSEELDNDKFYISLEFLLDENRDTADIYFREQNTFKVLHSFDFRNGMFNDRSYEKSCEDKFRELEKRILSGYYK